MPEPRVSTTGATAVSIVVPTRNRAVMLAHLLGEIGDHPLCEVIVVDDASTEPHATANAALASSRPRIRYVRQPTRRGAGAARNVGAADACGRYLWFIDDDDWVPATVVREVVRRLVAEAPALVALGARFVANGATVGEYRPTPARDSFAQYRHRGQLVSLPSLIFGRELFFACGGFDASMKAGQDTDLLLRVSRHASPKCWADLAVVIDVGARPRMTRGFWSQQYGKLQILRRHWSALTWTRRAYYLVSFALAMPLLRRLSGRSVAREIAQARPERPT